MQQTSDLYKDILSKRHHTETRLVIEDGGGYLLSKSGQVLLFGGTAIRLGSGPGNGYGENMLSSLETEIRLFSEDTPAVGCCVAGQISVRMKKPAMEFPRLAKLRPFVRLTDGARCSEWIPKGVFYVDTRKYDSKKAWLTLTGFDDMLKAEADYPSSEEGWPSGGRRDLYVVQDIAKAMGVGVDPRTKAIMDQYQKEGKALAVPLPAGYSMREVLSGIAAYYGGCFIMNELGQLRLVQLAE